jgi:hypothetical protein
VDIAFGFPQFSGQGLGHGPVQGGVMSRPVLPIIAGFVLMAGSSATAYAQATQPTQPTQATVSPQSAAQNSAASPSSPQPAQKKVWTNDELSAQDPRTGISTVGKETNSTARHTVSAHAMSANGRNAKWYQDQIAGLQAKIPVLDSQIADLQAALDGKPMGDGKKSVRPYGIRLDDWSRELAELQKRRDDTLSQISALRDQARHNGVAPNALP